MTKTPPRPRARTPRVPPSVTRARSLDASLNASLAMELINTETLHRGKQRDALPSPDALTRWWAEMCERYPDQCAVGGAGAPSAWTSELLDAVKSLRMALRTLATQVVERQAVAADELAAINAILAQGYWALERTRQGNVTAVMRPRDPARRDIVFALAVSALRLFTESDWRRLHQCKNDRCIVFFYDTTKSGTRRWCGPDCMNRARSIEHYHQTKASPNAMDAGSTGR